MNIYLSISVALNIGLVLLLFMAIKKLDKEIVDHGKTIKELGSQIKDNMLVLERENYVLKTMNDAMKVVDIRGFMAQRMSNAPSHFKPKTEEEINTDKVN